MRKLNIISDVVPRSVQEWNYDVEDPHRHLKQVYELSAKQGDWAVNQVVTFAEHASRNNSHLTQHTYL